MYDKTEVLKKTASFVDVTRVTFPHFVKGTTMYICMSALPFCASIFITFNKENYHVYCFM